VASHTLDAFFAARSVVVFGASERPEAVGTRVFENLVQGGFQGDIHAVNPKREQVLGRPCHPSLAALGQRVDLALIATPAATVPGILGQCGEQGVRAAVVYAAGFREAGDAARRELLAAARRAEVRLLGPNCLGFLRPHLGLNATFSRGGAQPGSLALVSGSGALCTAILDWASDRSVGFSAVVSLGEAADVGFGDVLDFLALDAKTQGILLYVEGIHRPRGFMSGLRAAARLKPVVVVKAGRRPAGTRAALTHTGALVGGDDAPSSRTGAASACSPPTAPPSWASSCLPSARPPWRGSARRCPRPGPTATPSTSSATPGRTATAPPWRPASRTRPSTASSSCSRPRP
jgi:acetyltransferase